jgi:hypothetical protein
MNWLSAKIGKRAYQDAQANKVFSWFHKGLAVVYLCAFLPMFFELDVLIGNEGFQPARDLLHSSYSHQGYWASFLQFPSLFHFLTNKAGLLLIVSLGCLGALGLLLSYQIFWSALIAWLSFLSITSVGGDFYIIIIDLFLAEVGFLTLFSSYHLQFKGYLPNLVVFAFKMLNFKLWFSMGMIKFYMPLSEWTNFTFFDSFFQAQPMPTPIAKLSDQAPAFLKSVAIIGLFVGEVILPFFVFAKAFYRKIAGAVFVLISILIQLNGNYGYFNILSIFLVLTIFRSSDFGFKAALPFEQSGKSKNWWSTFLVGHIVVQLIYCLLLFHPKPKYTQNHFNFIHTYLGTPTSTVVNSLVYPLKVLSYWRICNPYGVFKGIPKYHGEIRLSGSQDGLHWRNYTFKYLPSGLSDKLGFYAPYYPRLDHLMFYETLCQSNAQNNTLNPFYKNKAPWSRQFLATLFTDQPIVNKLLKRNPFIGRKPPKFIKTSYYQLQLNTQRTRNWTAIPTGFDRIYTKQRLPSKALIPLDIALLYLSPH